MNDDPLYDETGAGVFLGGIDSPISVRTMQRDRQKGTGPKFIKVGRLVRYRKSALNEHLNNRTFSSTSEADEASDVIPDAPTPKPP